ncbi:MAG TPA: pyrroline-5-carboxylate reductase [Ruminococcaceae bacterium]|nr:pyrroline-5-carboxylate reductase [Oscillospiraceae bacterium]
MDIKFGTNEVFIFFLGNQLKKPLKCIIVITPLTQGGFLLSAKIGFIGFGNIAQAIVKGASKGYITPEQIYIYDPLPEKTELATRYGFEVCQSEPELVSKCDYVFLTVKPQIYAEILSKIKASLAHEMCIVSVAAGKTISFIQQSVGFECRVIRAMPNTPLLVGSGVCALSASFSTPKESFDFITGLFSVCALTEQVDEGMLNAVTAVSGSGPAYVFAFARAVIEAGEQAGLSAQTAMQLFTSTLIGSAKMIQQYGNCGKLIEMVASPNGTTEAALNHMQENGFEPLVKSAVQACLRRAEELSK